MKGLGEAGSSFDSRRGRRLKRRHRFRGKVQMRRLSSCAALLAAVIAFGGCSYVSDSVVPSLAGEDPAKAEQPSPQRVDIPPSPGEMAAQSSASGDANSARPAAAGSTTNTEVGRK